MKFRLYQCNYTVHSQNFYQKKSILFFFEDTSFKYIYHVNYVFYRKSTWGIVTKNEIRGRMLINPNFNYENESASIVDSFLFF